MIIKWEILEFEGRASLDEYLDWVQSVERIFHYKGYTNEKRCKMTAFRLQEYASLWQDNLKAQRRCDDNRRTKRLNKMARLMQKHFALESYKQDLYMKLQGLKQYDLSVEKYVREFETLMLRRDAI